MTRTMYDAITPSRIPVNNPEIVAGYVNGSWPSYFEMVKRFPDAVHVSIAVNIYADAMCLDVEDRDATNDQAPDWCVRQRRRGQIPTVYTFQANWNALRAAFTRRGIAEPLYSIANTSTGPVMIPGAIAHQYKFTPGYDLSVVADYWPGVDPIRPPKPGPKPKPTPKPNPKPVHVVRPGDTLSSIAAGWNVSLAAVERANPHAGHPAGNFDVIWPGDRITHP